MNRRDLLWIGLRASGLFFLIHAILLVPAAIYAVRMREMLIGPDRWEELSNVAPHLLFGTTGVVTCVIVYLIAAVTLFLVPVRNGA